MGSDPKPPSRWEAGRTIKGERGGKTANGKPEDKKGENEVRAYRKMQWIGAALAVAMLFCAVSLLAGETKYDGTYGGAADTEASVLFGPNQYGQLKVVGLSATTDKDGGQVKFYARGGSGKVAVGGAQAAAATHVGLTNTGMGLNTNDTVVIVHATGRTEYRTVSGPNTTTNITLNSGVTYALTTGDYVYEVTQQGFKLVGLAGTGAGTNDVCDLFGAVFITPTDSPLYVVLDGTSNTVVQVTVE